MWLLSDKRVLLLALAVASSPLSFSASPHQDDEYNITHLDCSMRRIAYRHAIQNLPHLRPHEEARHVFDALRLDPLCNDSFFFPHEEEEEVLAAVTGGGGVGGGGIEQSSRRGRASLHDDGSSRDEKTDIIPHICPADECLYVHPIGKVNGDGSIDNPFQTAQVAITASRHWRSSLRNIEGNTPKTSSVAIVFRGGVHTLSSTLTIGPEDSHLQLLAYPGKEVWLSGGVNLSSLNFEPWDHHHNGSIFVANVSDILSNVSLPDVISLFTTEPHRRLIRARYPNANPEIDQWGYASPNRLKHSISADVVTWHRPPPDGPRPKVTYVDFRVPNNPSGVVKNDSTMDMYNVYTSGEGGVCETMWGPEESYWCSNVSAGGWAEVDSDCAMTGRLNIPVGLDYNKTNPAGERFQQWNDTSYGTGGGGPIIHAWHSQSWAMHMFEVSHHNKEAGTLTFRRGGYQGGRNWCRCDQCPYAGSWCRQHQDPPDNTDTRLISGSWVVENVLEELDSPGEFYLDREKMLLYVWPNATTAASPPTDLRLALLDTLTRIEGSQDRPVTDITIRGLNFRDAAPTYMGRWSAPSGGDWSLHRGGAVFLEGVTNVEIDRCAFRRLDGTAVFLSRYTRNVSIRRSHFEWLGESAVAAWGETDKYDATRGNQPRNTLVEECLMREIGIYQKQSSAWFQAKAALTTLRNNVMFNMGRAAINFNDMMGGGDVVANNVIFNTCRESGDHGPINSWDRMPFLTKLRYGKTTPSFVPIPRLITGNFIMANYGGSQAVDNDDGSSYFHITSNVFHASEGFKMDYGGHDSIFEDNLVVAYPYDGQNCVNLGDFKAGHGHVYRRNRCLVGLGGRNVGSGCGDPTCADRIPPEDPTSLELVVTLAQCQNSHVELADNEYYSPKGNATFHCGYEEDDGFHTLEEIHNRYGLEGGSTAGFIPDPDVIVGWAKDILGLLP